MTTTDSQEAGTREYEENKDDTNPHEHESNREWQNEIPDDRVPAFNNGIRR